MASRKESGAAGAGRGQTVKLRRKPGTRHSLRNGCPVAVRAGERHGVRMLTLLAAVPDRFVTGLGLTNDQASQHPLSLGAVRSLGLVLVCRRPELAREPEQLAAEIAGLIFEVVDRAAG